jgi:hypothetical protein
MKLKVKELREWANKAIANNELSLQVSVDEISKKELQELYERYNPPTAVSSTVTTTVDTTINTNLDGSVNSNPQPIDTNPTISPIIIPEIDSEEWTPFILSRLRQKEQYIDDKGNIFPTCDGLRRLFETYIGEIGDLTCHVVDPPSPSNERRATVTVTISYYKNGMLKSITDAADCYVGNTASPYCLYPVATATTMAESRCLRKGLRLTKVISADESRAADQEISEAFIQNDQKMTGNQRNAINNICEKLDINLIKLLESLENLKNKDINTLSYDDATVILKKLSLFSKGKEGGGETIPEELLNG